MPKLPIRKLLYVMRLPISIAMMVAVGLVLGAQSPGVPVSPALGQPGKDVSWVPTPDALIDRMFEMAALTSDDYLIDLGSGDGRLVIAAAKRGTRALGIEYDANLVDVAQRAAAVEGVSDRAKFVKADLFDTDLSQATVITMFLLPEINLKLRPKLLALAPGTRIMSNTFTMEDWDADDTRTTGQGSCRDWCTALMWVVPAKVAGRWEFQQGTLMLRQEFQKIAGTLTSAGRRMAIQDGHLRGNDVRFAVGNTHYEGHVQDDVIEGTATRMSSRSRWTVRRVP